MEQQVSESAGELFYGIKVLAGNPVWLDTYFMSATMTRSVRSQIGKKIQVIGAIGSGKSTTARGVAEHLGLSFIDLDAVRHQPGWTACFFDTIGKLPRLRFRLRRLDETRADTSEMAY